MINLKKSLNIILCDLTYDTIILVSDTMPVNIGFVGSYVKKIFGDQINLSLFKYPKRVIEEIKKNPPDVIACSNYSWNSNLSEHVLGIAKKANPDVITVQGGTNFPHEDEQQKEFLIARPNTDIHVLFEGEKALQNIIQRVFDSDMDKARIFDSPIDGTAFLSSKKEPTAFPKLVKGNVLERIKNLDEIPSPYLTGMMDVFFDGKLTPFIETNRGCPFRCSFCHTGNDHFQKTNTFSTDRIHEEIRFIGPRAQELGITNLHIADTNFGMYPRDREVCLALKESKEKYGWPLQIMATTGKNNKKRVVEITGILGNMFAVNMSVQSMNDNVLEKIKRSNINLEDYIEVNKSLQQNGRSTKAEIILPLPGETRETFLRGIDDLINSGVTSITIYTLMLLNGTEFKDTHYRKEFDIKGRFRIVPLNFGEYDGKKIFDFEEVGIQTKDMSFDDYLNLRGFALMIESLINGRAFEEFFIYAENLGVGRTEFLRRIYDNIKSAPNSVQRNLENFLGETKGELWNSEKELVEFYQQEKNYHLLKSGKVGGNLIYKYKALNVVFASSEWIDFISEQLNAICREKKEENSPLEQSEIEIGEIAKFCRNKLAGLFDVEADLSPVSVNLNFDVLDWLDSDHEKPLRDFRVESPISFQFEYDEEQLRTRNDQFSRYGTDVNALSKIVTRITSLESQFRKISKNGSPIRGIFNNTQAAMTKYTLAN
ncbi:MAG: radical SAM protein [Nitrospinota bacterium]